VGETPVEHLGGVVEAALVGSDDRADQGAVVPLGGEDEGIAGLRATASSPTSSSRPSASAMTVSRFILVTLTIYRR
jgi:hypothetical protein